MHGLALADAVGDDRVVDARAVQMGGEAARMREIGRILQILARQHPARDGVFERQQARAREMHIVGLDRMREIVDRDRAIGLVVQGLRLDAAEHRGPALLVLVGVRFLADQIFVAAPAMRHQRREIALRAARKEQRGFTPEALGHDSLQTVDGRIVAINIVTDFGRGHRGAHAGRGPGDGVAAQIDEIRGAHRVPPAPARRRATPRAPWPRFPSIRFPGRNRRPRRHRPSRRACRS